MKQFTQTFASLLVLWVLSTGTAQAQDTVRVGSRVLEGAVLQLGTTSIESFKLQQGVRTPVSQTMQTIEQAVEDGVPVYRVSIVHWAPGRGDSGSTSILVRQKDLALLRHKVKARHDSAVVLYTQGFLSGWVVLPNKPILLIDAKTSHPVLPVDGPAPWFLSALPLKEDFHAIIPKYSMWERDEFPEEVRVLGSEILERNGTNVECWKIDNGPFAIPGYRAYRWVDKRTKRILQSVLRGKADDPEYWSIAE